MKRAPQLRHSAAEKRELIHLVELCWLRLSSV